jgi:hypothetical protein
MKIVPTCGLVNTIKLGLVGLHVGILMQDIHSLDDDTAKIARRLGGRSSMLP